MDINHIREFVILAECRNFSEAAERLFISQSALSKHIRALEKEMGTPLFNRTTRSIRLSEAGKLFLPYAQKLTVLCMESAIALDDLKHQSSTSLIIAVLQNPQYYDLAKYIIGFRQMYPDLSFSMVEADESGLYEMFQNKTVNIFPTFSNFTGAGDFCFMPMVESTIVALFRRNQFGAPTDRVSLRQLGAERLLLPNRGGSLSSLVLTAFRREGIVPQVVYEGSSIGCIDLVKAGMGVSLHAREFANTLAGDEDVCCAELDPAIPFVYGMGHRPPADLSHAEQLYLSYMKQFERK